MAKIHLMRLKTVIYLGIKRQALVKSYVENIRNLGDQISYCEYTKIVLYCQDQALRFWHHFDQFFTPNLYVFLMVGFWAAKIRLLNLLS